MSTVYWFRRGLLLFSIYIATNRFFVASHHCKECVTPDNRQGLCVAKRYCREARNHTLVLCDGCETFCCPATPEPVTVPPFYPPTTRASYEGSRSVQSEKPRSGDRPIKDYDDAYVSSSSRDRPSSGRDSYVSSVNNRPSGDRSTHDHKDLSVDAGLSGPGSRERDDTLRQRPRESDRDYLGPSRPISTEKDGTTRERPRDRDRDYLGPSRPISREKDDTTRQRPRDPTDSDRDYLGSSRPISREKDDTSRQIPRESDRDYLSPSRPISGERDENSRPRGGNTDRDYLDPPPRKLTEYSDRVEELPNPPPRRTDTPARRDEEFERPARKRIPPEDVKDEVFERPFRKRIPSEDDRDEVFERPPRKRIPPGDDRDEVFERPSRKRIPSEDDRDEVFERPPRRGPSTEDSSKRDRDEDFDRPARRRPITEDSNPKRDVEDDFDRPHRKIIQDESSPTRQRLPSSDRKYPETYDIRSQSSRNEEDSYEPPSRNVDKTTDRPRRVRFGDPDASPYEPVDRDRPRDDVDRSSNRDRDGPKREDPTHRDQGRSPSYDRERPIKASDDRSPVNRPRPESRREQNAGPKQVPGCGVKPYELFIAGGEESKEHEWPWMTAIFRRYESARPKAFVCGGSLINTQYILTAAHCFVKNYATVPASAFVVRLGAHAANSGEEYTISEIILHQNHSKSDYFNDIALVRLASEVWVTDKVAPICLPHPGTLAWNLVDKLATVAGWGDVAFRTTGSRLLHHVSVPIVSSDECYQAYARVRGAAFLARGSDHVLCAGLREGGKDACPGDSGGPLMLQDSEGKWVIVGIVSLGYECAKPGYPGVYTRVTHYMSWIKNHVKDY